ncbi:unnamed protein product [Paramecium pentaurelia]|uniref:cytochrome-b5 reductase n=1 Tax=Paramecium pentaurelia TaxID=43138 RepID=A0A8S1SKV0_9CILI|nr:unnamed protein product [Paramecium pentaurelia]
MSSIDYDKTFDATLVKKDQITHDTYLFGFQSEVDIQLEPAEHFQILMKDSDGIDINRNYTPILSQKRYFEVPIKIYPSGSLTPILEKLSINSKLQMQRKIGKLAYLGANKFIIAPKINKQFQVFKTMLMICGGTGITPAFSIIKHVCQNKDPLQMHLLYANKTSKDILLKDQLSKFQNECSNLKVTYILDKEPGYNGLQGYVTLDVLKQVFPSPNNDMIGTFCGPTAMNKIVAELYKNYNIQTVVKF